MERFNLSWRTPSSVTRDSKEMIISSLLTDPSKKLGQAMQMMVWDLPYLQCAQMTLTSTYVSPLSRRRSPGRQIGSSTGPSGYPWDTDLTSGRTTSSMFTNNSVETLCRSRRTSWFKSRRKVRPWSTSKSSETRVRENLHRLSNLSMSARGTRESQASEISTWAQESITMTLLPWSFGTRSSWSCDLET